MIEDLSAAFAKFEDEYLKFERIENPMHPRPDVCAFLMLHKLVGGAGDMIAAAEHDIIYLEVDTETLATAATEDDIRDLRRCGVMWDNESDCLAMFA